MFLKIQLQEAEDYINKLQYALDEAKTKHTNQITELTKRIKRLQADVVEARELVILSMENGLSTPLSPERLLFPLRESAVDRCLPEDAIAMG